MSQQSPNVCRRRPPAYFLKMIATRRFFWRPSGSSEQSGFLLGAPASRAETMNGPVGIRKPSFSVSQRFTAWARRSDNFGCKGQKPLNQCGPSMRKAPVDLSDESGGVFSAACVLQDVSLIKSKRTSAASFDAYLRPFPSLVGPAPCHQVFNAKDEI